MGSGSPGKERERTNKGDAMSESRYVPHQDVEGYPGANISPERAERIRKLDLGIEEITVDDIVYNVSRNGSSIFYLALKLVSEACGEEEARDIARKIGYTAGRSNYRKMQKRFGVTTLGPERAAIYEDTVHLLSGSDMAYCFSEYDGEKCVVRRTRCSFHTGHPPEAGHYCWFLNEGFKQAYEELDPNLEVTYEKSMTKGDSCCEHVFRYRNGGGAETSGSADGGSTASEPRRPGAHRSRP